MPMHAWLRPCTECKGEVVDFQLNLNTETVEQVASGKPLCIEPETPVRDVLRLLKNENRGCALICRDEKLIGIFTERDALKLMADRADLQQPIERAMTRQPVTLSASDTVGKAISKMSFGGYRRLPIVDAAGRPVAVLKVSGILRYLVEHFPQIVYTLPPSPHQTTQQREGA